MRIELSCRQCGGNNFTLDAAATDACAVSCLDCGHVVGTLGELKAQIAGMVVASSARGGIAAAE